MDHYYEPRPNWFPTCRYCGAFDVRHPEQSRYCEARVRAHRNQQLETPPKRPQEDTTLMDIAIAGAVAVDALLDSAPSQDYSSPDSGGDFGGGGASDSW